MDVTDISDKDQGKIIDSWVRLRMQKMNVNNERRN